MHPPAQNYREVCRYFEFAQVAKIIQLSDLGKRERSKTSTLPNPKYLRTSHIKCQAEPLSGDARQQRRYEQDLKSWKPLLHTYPRIKPTMSYVRQPLAATPQSWKRLHNERCYHFRRAGCAARGTQACQRRRETAGGQAARNGRRRQAVKRGQRRDSARAGMLVLGCGQHGGGRVARLCNISGSVPEVPDSTGVGPHPRIFFVRRRSRHARAQTAEAKGPAVATRCNGALGAMGEY